MAERKRTVARFAATAALVATVTGCAFMRDPLDPLGELDHRPVRSFTDAERAARSRAAFERARQRVGKVKRGMSVAEFEVAMGAVVATERQSPDIDEDELPRRKLIDGFLCRRTSSAVRERWLFGYDEGGVELVGFVIELERDDPERAKWEVIGIDRNPPDDCPDAGEQ
jgi:hypothetical protein